MHQNLHVAHHGRHSELLRGPVWGSGRNRSRHRRAPPLGGGRHQPGVARGRRGGESRRADERLGHGMRQEAAIEIRRKKFFLPSSTLSQICFSSLDNKTVRPAFSDSQNRSHNLPEPFDDDVTAVFLLFFYFLFWLNFWKITKIIKNIKWKIQFF